ncbi:MAG: hypothetical protein WAL29_07675 [Bacteroidales bacterium]
MLLKEMKMKLIAGLKVPPGGFRGRFLAKSEGEKKIEDVTKRNEDEVNKNGLP